MRGMGNFLYGLGRVNSLLVFFGIAMAICAFGEVTTNILLLPPFPVTLFTLYLIVCAVAGLAYAILAPTMLLYSLGAKDFLRAARWVLIIGLILSGFLTVRTFTSSTGRLRREC
jgi:hypothetical protein